MGKLFGVGDCGVCQKASSRVRNNAGLFGLTSPVLLISGHTICLHAQVIGGAAALRSAAPEAGSVAVEAGDVDVY